ncbi:MAG: sel1 repeat family protein [Proteobacteria bacterium]|nr:sel1 repeat family protein [Pseudomonadota bacterium]
MHILLTSILTVLLLILSPISSGADFAKGQQAYSSGDYQAAIMEWQPLAEEGHADGQFGMGLLYANGFGVPLDDDQALKWYLLAADQKHAEAQCNLAVMHANGWGVPQSDAEAFKWYSLAAEQGITQAQIAVARMYSGGFGAAQDKVQAHKWFNIASEFGDYDAASKRDDLAGRMSADEIAAAAQLANTWLESHQHLLVNQ